MIRNVETINASVEVIKTNKVLAVEHAKLEFQTFYDSVLSHKQDIIDVIDTFNYCISKGLEKNLSEFTSTKWGRIFIKDNMLRFQFNEWRSENSGPYNWFVSTDGKEVYISVDENTSDVPTMIANMRYKEDKTTGDKIIAPIFEWFRGEKAYTCHSHTRPLSALKEFDRLLPAFIEKFFTAIDNLGK